MLIFLLCYCLSLLLPNYIFSLDFGDYCLNMHEVYKQISSNKQDTIAIIKRVGINLCICVRYKG